MDPVAHLHTATGTPPERAPLTRLRASSRAVLITALPGDAVVAPLLPDAVGWGGLFGGPAVTAAECATLNELARARRVSPGTALFSRHERATALVAVLEGDVALGVRQSVGAFRTERHLHGPAWLDVAAAWLGEAPPQDARALSTATVLELPRDVLQVLLERQHGLARRLILTLAREVRLLAGSTQDLMHKDAPARLAAWLREHCVPDGPSAAQAMVQLPLRKRDIASQLAITPETLSRLMRSFTSQGVIQVAGYTVHVLDVPALERLASA